MRNFTVDEANALLPRLVELLGILRAHHVALVEAHGKATAQAPSNGGGQAGAKVLTSSEKVARAVATLQEWGVLLRDPETGLVDFPSERDGEAVYLCWRLGEEQVAWWHPVDAGVAGRRPL